MADATKVQRCETCDLWKPHHAQCRIGICRVPLPWWLNGIAERTHYTEEFDGTNCETWKAKADG